MKPAVSGSGANPSAIELATAPYGTGGPALIGDSIRDPGTSGDEPVDLETLKDELAQLKRTVAGIVRRRKRKAGHLVKETIAEALWYGLDGVAFTTDNARKTVCAAEDAVRRKPLQALLCAFVAGALVGARRR